MTAINIIIIAIISLIGIILFTAIINKDKAIEIKNIIFSIIQRISDVIIKG